MFEHPWTLLSAEGIARLAVDAIKAERDIAPRPPASRDGLQKDALFSQAERLYGFFADCARLGEETDDLRSLFLLIREKGLEAEKKEPARPLKGAGFALGILCAAAGHNQTHDGIPDTREICGLALSMSRMALRGEIEASAFRGARGEASNGFPAVQRIALPKFKAYLRQGLDRNAAFARAYLPLIANVQDTAAIRSSGAGEAKRAADEAARLMEEAVTDEALKAFYDGLAARGFVFDGCAALMACLIFFTEYAER